MAWNYGSPIDQVALDQLPTEWVWERLRLRRDALIAVTDWRMVSDAPWDTEPWAQYRQALRDLPDNTTDPRLAVWPVSPA
jgi:hypothetical protein